MTLLWLALFCLFGSDWTLAFGFGDAEFSTAAGWLVFCVAADLAGGASGARSS